MTGLLEEVRAGRDFDPSEAKAIRRLCGVSQSRLARELHVHRVSLARWEDGTRRPRGDRLVRYSQALAELRAELTG
jgi:DNA-binding transcriptional regulator YiaG